MFYGLERLWGNAERVDVPPATLDVASTWALTRALPARRRPLRRPRAVLRGVRRAPRTSDARPGLRRLLAVDPAARRRRSANAAAIRCRRGGVISVPLARCPRCRRGRRVVDRARAVGAYDGALRAIVHALKYDGRRSLAAAAGGADAEPVRATCWRARTASSRCRFTRRGDARADSTRRSISPGSSARTAAGRARRFAASAPRRRRPAFPPHSATGTCATRSRRAPAPARCAGTIVVLVDDVSTTGATLEACARVLKEAGVARGPRAYGGPSRDATALKTSAAMTSFGTLAVEHDPVLAGRLPVVAFAHADLQREIALVAIAIDGLALDRRLRRDVEHDRQRRPAAGISAGRSARPGRGPDASP